MGVFKAWDDEKPAPHTNGHVTPVATTNGTTAYARAALERELSSLVSAAEGTRNQTLNDVTFNVAQLVNAGLLGHNVYDELAAAARSTGLTATEVIKTMASARSGADSKPRTKLPSPHGEYTVPTPTVLRVEETKDFWEARPVLTHIRDFARARLVSPWALLGITLARTVSQVPPFVVLPAFVGGRASLNLFVGVVGDSGAGKGGAEAASLDVIDSSENVETVTIGSGEAIAHAYMERRQNKETKAWEIRQHSTRVLFSVAEIDTLAALKSRTSSTVMPELRKAWMGEQLGFHYVDPTRRLPVPAHEYRLCMVAGIQPKRAGVLLEDADGGTPQRFVWVPAADPEAPDLEPEEPPAWTWKLPRWPMAGAHGVELPVCDTARDTIKQARRDRLRGKVEALDGHALLARLKVAAALALLEQRAEVTDDDWGLADTVMAVSDAVRGHVVASLAAATWGANVAKGRAEAERAVMVDESRHEAVMKRAIRAANRRLDAAGGDWVTEGQLRKFLTSADRGYLTEALQRLAADGLVESEEATRGVRYRRQR